MLRYQDKRLLGTRDILGEEDEIQNNGKMFRKLELGDYRWMSYDEVHGGRWSSNPNLRTPQVDAMADSFGRGLRTLGQKPQQNICLFADTRMEWLVAAQVLINNSDEL